MSEHTAENPLYAAAADLLRYLRELIEYVEDDDLFHDPENEPDAYAVLVLAQEAVKRAQGRDAK